MPDPKQRDSVAPTIQCDSLSREASLQNAFRTSVVIVCAAGETMVGAGLDGGAVRSGVVGDSLAAKYALTSSTVHVILE